MSIRGWVMRPSVFSTSVQGTPRQPRSPAMASPTGPPPTISTGVDFMRSTVLTLFRSGQTRRRDIFGTLHGCATPARVQMPRESRQNIRMINVAASDTPISVRDPLALADVRDTAALMRDAAQLRDARFGSVMTYSRKVFIPLTHLCRDSCHYCTFAQPPRRGQAAYMTPEDVLAVARAGARVGATEALFTLGDKPELRYAAARDALAGSATRRRSTISPPWPRVCSRKPACCRISIPASWAART